MSENNNPVSRVETWIETESNRLYTEYKQLYAEYKQIDYEYVEYIGGVRRCIGKRLGIIEKYKRLIDERERLDDEYKRLDDERKRIYHERKRLDDERKRLDAKRSELLDSEQLDDEDVDHFEEFEPPYGGSGWCDVILTRSEIKQAGRSEIMQANDAKCGRYIVARERLKLIINGLGNWLDAEHARRVTSTLKQVKDYLTSTEDIESVIQIIRIRQAYNMEYLAYARAEGIEGIIEDIEGIARFLFSGNIRRPKNIDEYGNPDWGFEELEHKIRSSESDIWIKRIIAEVWRLDLDDGTKGKQSDQ